LSRSSPDRTGCTPARFDFGGFLSSAAKWVGVGAAVACIVASGGICGVVTAVAIGLSVANNFPRAASGRVSWWGALRDSAIDAIGGRFKAVRSLGRYLPRHFGGYGSRIGRFLGHGHINGSYRQAWQAGRARTVYRASVQAYYGARSYTGINGIAYHHRYLDD
jgi:hypothetical protein